MLSVDVACWVARHSLPYQRHYRMRLGYCSMLRPRMKQRQYQHCGDVTPDADNFRSSASHSRNRVVGTSRKAHTTHRNYPLSQGLLVTSMKLLLMSLSRIKSKLRSQIGKETRLLKASQYHAYADGPSVKSRVQLLFYSGTQMTKRYVRGCKEAAVLGLPLLPNARKDLGVVTQGSEWSPPLSSCMMMVCARAHLPLGIIGICATIYSVRFFAVKF